MSCTNGDRKMKIKSKTNFQVRCSFTKLFSQNLQIQAPFCEVIISKLGQRDSNCVSCTTEVKIPKSETFSDRIPEFSNIDPNCEIIIPIFIIVHIELVLIFLPQIVFDISVWFHFGVTLIFLSPFA